MNTTYQGPNAAAIEAWDTILFEKFVRFRHVLTDGLAVHGHVAMERVRPRPGARALDVGCGFGDTTLDLAKHVGPRGGALGVDCSHRFIESATRDARSAAVENVLFGARDAQVDDLGGPYDLVFSRFGTMFFANVVQALRNMRRSLAPDGKLCMVVWRKRRDNEWLYVAERAARAILPEFARGDDAVTCGPGPFSMADADVVSEQLAAAGFDRVTFERCDAPIVVGRDLDEAVAFSIALGPAGELIRLAGELGQRKKPELAAALHEAFAGRRSPDGSIRAPSSTWIVTASRRD